MTDIVATLAPVFLLILLGHVIKRRAWVHEAFWAPAERLTFYGFFPALLVSNIARAELDTIDVWPMLAALIAGVLAVAGLVLALRPRLALDGPGFTSVFQGSFRPNTYVAVAAALALFGEAGLALMAVCIVVVVPLVNFLSVVVMVRVIPRPAGETAGENVADGRPAGWRETLVPVITNPLIGACLLGAALNFSGLGIPPLAAPLLDILGAAALPIGLLAVGAGLDLGAARRAKGIVALTTGFKLVVLPAATYAACLVFGVGGLTAAVVVMYATVPGSSTAYVMARQMGGDATLLAGIITMTTLGSMAAMPLAVVLLI